MRTKQEYLLSIPFEYLIAFSRKTGLIRRNGYYTKKDFVQHLLRSVKVSECKQLCDFYNAGVSYQKSAEYFLDKYPTGVRVSGAFVDYLKKTTTNLGILLFEFPIPKTRVDILRLNNFSHAYEVKSQRDRIDRLCFQLPALRKIFERVYLIYPFNLKDKIKRVTNRTIGLYGFKAKNSETTFEIEREAEKLDEFESDAQLGLLRMDELKAICLDLFGEKPLHKTKREMINIIVRHVKRYEINSLFKKSIQTRAIIQTRTSMLVKMNGL